MKGDFNATNSSPGLIYTGKFLSAKEWSDAVRSSYKFKLDRVEVELKKRPNKKKKQPKKHHLSPGNVEDGSLPN